MKKSRKKNHRRYVVYRVVWLAMLGYWIAAGLIDDHYDLWGDALQSVFFLLFPLIFAVFNVAVFRFPYSIFGALEKSREPNDRPIASNPISWGGVGWLSATIPFVSWRAYSEGLAFTIIGVGRGFITMESITRIRRPLYLIGWAVEHNSPEIRTPVFTPGGRVLKTIRSLRNVDREHAVIEPAKHLVPADRNPRGLRPLNSDRQVILKGMRSTWLLI